MWWMSRAALFLLPKNLEGVNVSELVPALTAFNVVFPVQHTEQAARVWHLQYQLERFERLSPDMHALILGNQLKHLLSHANRYSSYWGEALPNPLPGKQRHIDELLDLVKPISRKDVQQRYPDLIANFPDREKLGVLHSTTSGSTGTPVKVERLRKLYMPLYHAATLVTARWHKIDPRRPLANLSSTVQDREKLPAGIPFRWFSPVAYGFTKNTKNISDEELYDYCVRRGPSYLNCGPVTVVGMARYAVNSGRRDLSVEAALTLGSGVTDEMREIVRRGLGARMIDRYSSEETGHISIQCPKYNHMHVLTPITYVEIVDENDKRCSVGQPGRVLVTSMQSYGMPLIRYELGDIAEWGEPCDCGITFPVIRSVLGRTRQLITNPDGRTTFARIYARDFEDLKALLEYRFVLHSDGVVVAQLKVSEEAEGLAAAVTERVQRALGYPYLVRVRYVATIDWASTWKMESFAVSNLPSGLPAKA
jgi:phenylacetate-CoA ligase